MWPLLDKFRICSRILFADTEFAEERIEHILDIDSSGNAPQRPGRGAQIFGREFRQSGGGKATERRDTSLQRLTMSGPGNERRRIGGGEAGPGTRRGPATESRESGRIVLTYVPAPVRPVT